MSAAAADHGFIVPAFGEPAWIERCLDSIQQQTHPTDVVITTSTPTERLSSIAGRRGIPLIVNTVARGIAADWNFALAHARADWVSLAHQDDWYDRRYVELCLAAAARARDAILVFTHATERIDGESGEVFNAR